MEIVSIGFERHWGDEYFSQNWKQKYVLEERWKWEAEHRSRIYKKK